MIHIKSQIMYLYTGNTSVETCNTDFRPALLCRLRVQSKYLSSNEIFEPDDVYKCFQCPVVCTIFSYISSSIFVKF